MAKGIEIFDEVKQFLKDEMADNGRVSKEEINKQCDNSSQVFFSHGFNHVSLSHDRRQFFFR